MLTSKILRFIVSLCAAAFLAVAVGATGGANEAVAQGRVPSAANITVREGSQPGEVTISWDAVPQATYYRIGYVNMEVDYHFAKGSCTEEWIEAFVYVDVNARNIPVNNGRAAYTVRRLDTGARHAFTVLTSSNFVDTGGGGSVGSEFFWPPIGSRWEFLPGRDALPTGVTIPTIECEAAAVPGQVPPTGDLEVTEGSHPGEVTVSWAAVPQASHYRIGYVNMEVDYHFAKASCTEEWIEAFVYVDVNARNIPVNNGRAEYTVRRLSPGARHAFTVLTSNNFVDTGGGGSVSSVFFWPPIGSRWEFLPGRDTLPAGVTIPTPDCSEAPGTPDADRAVLVALYNATGGANWTNNSNWLSDSPIGEWHGVTTNANGRVTRINLLENQLSGRIPSGLGNLTNLEYLNLGGNQLTGSLPSDLANLSNLTFLTVHRNRLSGSIPTWLGHLSNLETLSLGGNQFAGQIPSSLGGLSSLTGLYLWENQLNGNVPMWLGNMTDLEGLNLGDNELTGRIPPSLGNLSNLTFLALRGNQLNGQIPTELGNLASLERLYLNDNQLSGPLPSTLGDLSELIQLNLQRNRLEAEIPAELGNLTNLTRLQLNENMLSGSIPSGLQNLSSLEYLYLWRNDLTGQVPNWLGSLANLKRINLGGNGLTGTLPTELQNLSSLEELHLWDNELTGPLPSWLGNFSALKWLSLSNNQLSGSIPSSLGNLSDLEELELNNNQLSGSVPTSLGSLSNLEVLELDDNQLTGTIPPQLGNLTNLTVLKVNENQLTGTIPTGLGNLTNLTELVLHNNQFTGIIPSQLQNLGDLVRLDLGSNQLSGLVPTWLGGLTDLQRLSLTNNQLTGTIPSQLGNFTKLQRLSLSRNQLTGSIPTSLGNLVEMERLLLYDNQLTGAIPASFSNLTNLTILRIAGTNQFTGCIPAVLSNVAENDLVDLGLPDCVDQIPTSGSGMDVFDQPIVDLITQWRVPGGAFALARDGKLLVAKGYGYADIETGEHVQPDSLFRTASVSKPITAVAILALLQDERLTLDELAFDILERLQPVSGPADPRVSQITVRHLLQHSGGWDRSVSGDFTWQPITVQEALGVPAPVGCEEFVRYGLTQQLDFDPGTRFAYANVGYCSLGRIIEEKTGQTYEEFVNSRVLQRAGIKRMQMGGTLLEDRTEGEVRYYDATDNLVPSVMPDGPRQVPRPYGGYYLAGRDAVGGWIASPIDLVRFVSQATQNPQSSVLTSSNVDLMLSRPGFHQGSSYYGMGWGVNLDDAGNPVQWGHSGTQPGVRTMLYGYSSGIAWAAMFNTQTHDATQFRRDVVNAMEGQINGVSQWPSHDLFALYGY